MHEGKEYFIDWRLHELRNINDPQDQIPFTDLEDEEFKAELRGRRFREHGQEYMKGLDDPAKKREPELGANDPKERARADDAWYREEQRKGRM